MATPNYDTTSREQALRARLTELGQQHLFTFWGKLTPPEQSVLLDQMEGLPLDSLRVLIQHYVLADQPALVPAMEELEPVRPWTHQPPAGKERLYAQALEQGHAALAQGLVGAMTAAGGQGTRLGFDGPKGAYPLGPVSRHSLFQMFAESLLRAQDRYGVSVPWFIMTSPTTDSATRLYFETNNYFGLSRDAVRFFCQGQMPAFSPDGRILLAGPGQIALSPDGHGGILEALERSGSLWEMGQRGLRYLSLFQVDNPLVRCLDPLFIGLHILEQSEMSCKALPKSHDKEGLGNFCFHKGKLLSIEYSDFPESYAHARNPEGSRRFDCGNISIYVLSVSFLERLVQEQIRLPFHRAFKKVPCVDIPSGQKLSPAAPNAYKLERFLFDALPYASRPLVMSTIRHEEFSPVKNLTGDNSVQSCQKDMIGRACRWLEAAGVHVPRDLDGTPRLQVEISPRFADGPEELAGQDRLPAQLVPGTAVYIGA